MRLEGIIKARVIEDYKASDADPLIVQAGEKLRIGDADTIWPAFVRCWNQAGKGGWVPVNYLEINDEFGQAIVDYSAAELSVSKGEALLLQKEVGGWYWAKKPSGEQGWLPVENVQLLISR